VKLDGVGEEYGMVNSCLWEPKISKDMIIPIFVLNCKLEIVRTTHEGLAQLRKI